MLILKPTVREMWRDKVLCAQAEELFLWVPRKMLMTVESAQNSLLGKKLEVNSIIMEV